MTISYNILKQTFYYYYPIIVDFCKYIREKQETKFIAFLSRDGYFPYLLYKVALGHKIDADPTYTEGVKCRWLMGDLDHLYLKLFSKMQFTKREKILSLFSFLNIFDFNMKYEVNKLDDIRPFIFEIRQYIKSIINK